MSPDNLSPRSPDHTTSPKKKLSEAWATQTVSKSVDCEITLGHEKNSARPFLGRPFNFSFYEENRFPREILVYFAHSVSICI